MLRIQTGNGFIDGAMLSRGRKMFQHCVLISLKDALHAELTIYLKAYSNLVRAPVCITAAVEVNDTVEAVTWLL